MNSVYLSSALWLLTIIFVIFLFTQYINVDFFNRNISKSLLVVLPISLGILVFFSLAFFIPQTETEKQLLLVNIEGQGSQINKGDTIKFNLYDVTTETMGYIELDAEDVTITETDKPSYMKHIHRSYDNTLYISMFGFLVNDTFEVYENKNFNMTALYKDDFLYPAGYTETNIEGLDKIKKELDSLEKQLAGEKEEQ